MQLSLLLQDTFPISADIDCEVANLAIDSRRVSAGDLFFAYKGSVVDGRDFMADAIAKGAAVVLFDTELANQPIQKQGEALLIPIQHLAQQLGFLAARYYNYPGKKLRLIGVTGTNGKTSCTHFIAQALHQLLISCGIIGTLGYGFYGGLTDTGLTTPDAVQLQKALHTLLQEGAKAVAIEVSSHSIDQDRIQGMDFEIGIFTNLTQDHLDYHGTMQAYAAVKQRFMTETHTQKVIINIEDNYGKAWIDTLSQHKPVFAYTTQKPTSFSSTIPLVYCQDTQLSLQGIRTTVVTPWGEGELLLPLIGQFNLSNALAVLTALCVYGISFEQAVKQLSMLKPVPGRMQTLGGGNKPLVVVDYAHTPDALEKVLETLRSHCQGRLYCVFGCGGNRDPGKRRLMAKIAEQWADQVIVTNDNPRHEKTETIARNIMQGFSHPEKVWLELDRSRAIEKAIHEARVEDCILIAGKGAEKYQQIGDEKMPFDDVAKAAYFLG